VRHHLGRFARAIVARPLRRSPPSRGLVAAGRARSGPSSGERWPSGNVTGDYVHAIQYVDRAKRVPTETARQTPSVSTGLRRQNKRLPEVVDHQGPDSPAAVVALQPPIQLWPTARSASPPVPLRQAGPGEGCRTEQSAMEVDTFALRTPSPLRRSRGGQCRPPKAKGRGLRAFPVFPGQRGCRAYASSVRLVRIFGAARGRARWRVQPRFMISEDAGQPNETRCRGRQAVTSAPSATVGGRDGRATAAGYSICLKALRPS